MAAAFVNVTGKQNHTATLGTQLVSDAWVLTAGNLAVVTMRRNGSASSNPADYTCTDTLGNDYGPPIFGSIGSQVSWICNNCLGGSAVVTVTFPSSNFSAITGLQFTGQPEILEYDQAGAGAVGTSTTLSPASAHTDQIAILYGDIGGNAVPTISPASASFTSVYTNGPAGNGPFVGNGSTRVGYNLNTARDFDGTEVVTVGNGIPGSTISIDVLIIRRPVTVTTESAAPVSVTTATLHGTVIPNDSSQEVFFRWDVVDPPVAHDTAIAGTVANVFSPTTTAFETAVTGLPAGQRIYYRAVAIDDLGVETLGDVVSFRVVTYEDPCTITQAELFATVNTGTEVLKVGIKGLRDSAAMGGYAEPRLLEVSPITRASSDPSTGAFPAQTASMRWADTDQETRGRSLTRAGFRNADGNIYLTSLAQRIAGGPPRLLMAGKVRANSHDAFLAEGFDINDLLSVDYSLFAEEKMIPQRQIDLNWFPNAPVASLALGEPIIGGRRAPLSPDNTSADTSRHEGIVPTILVGRVSIGGTPGTPTGTTLAAVVTALNTSGAGGTLYTDYGSRIGFADAIALQSYYDSNGTVPSDYDSLAQIIGYGDLDALLAEGAATGGTDFVTCLIAGHAIKEILNGTNGDPSIWIDDTQVSAAQIGVSVFIDLSRDLLGADGTTRRYALIRFSAGSTYGDQVEAGGRVHVDCTGLESAGDSTGVAITDAFALYRHLLINFILQDYQTGSWLSPPTFLFSDGTTVLDRLNSDSFDAASTIAALSLDGGRVGSFTIGTRTPNRDIITKCNQSWGCLLAQDDYQRLFIKVLDTRRTEFYTNASGSVHRVLRDKIDFLSGAWLEPKPDWQANRLFYQYAKNDYAGSFERGSGGGGTDMKVDHVVSQATDGVITKTLILDYVRDDATGRNVAESYRDLFGPLPYVAHYGRRGLCGLEDDVLDGVPITHFNFLNLNGVTGDAFWILSKTYTNYHCEYLALMVEPLLTAIEHHEPDVLTSDPVALEFLVADDDASAVLALDT